MIDIHSHIIPGIDDGATDLNNSIMLIQGLREAGFDQVIGTPHIIQGFYENNRGTIEPAFNNLSEELTNLQIPVKISFAAEYFLDESLLARLKNQEPLLPLWGDKILTEFSFGGPPEDVKEFSFALQIAGYQPILAHPERYLYLHHDFEKYIELKEYGFLFQMNLLSLTTLYSKRVSKMASELLKRGVIDFIGSDVHNATQLTMLNKSFKPRDIQDLVKKHGLKNAQSPMS